MGAPASADMIRGIALTMLFGVLGLWLLMSAVRALRTGRANAAGTSVSVKERPGFFGLTVAAQLAFAALSLWVAAVQIFGLLPPAP